MLGAIKHFSALTGLIALKRFRKRLPWRIAGVAMYLRDFRSILTKEKPTGMSELHDLQLCADDFGLSEGIDLAIIDLIQRGRLTATSCMMAGPSLQQHADELKSLHDHVDIGLHLTFTDLKPLGTMPRTCPSGEPLPLKVLMARSFTGGVDYSEIKAEIGRQVDAFELMFGFPPDFVDGHQHVHLLPPIRRALFEHYREGRLTAATAIRNCADTIPAIIGRGIEVPKTLFIAALSFGLAHTARRLGVPVNDSFRGVTAFDASRPLRPVFSRFLEGASQTPLLMCHPGLPGFEPYSTDVIAAARVHEYSYLSSDAFEADLEAANARLRRRPR